MTRQALLDALMQPQRKPKMRFAQAYDPGGEYSMESAMGSYIEPDTPEMRGMPAGGQMPQIPPVPPGVVPGTDDYFAWLESTGSAKSPQDLKNILMMHEKQMGGR